MNEETRKIEDVVYITGVFYGNISSLHVPLLYRTSLSVFRDSCIGWIYWYEFCFCLVEILRLLKLVTYYEFNENSYNDGFIIKMAFC
jgi:hypothetical protein